MPRWNFVGNDGNPNGTLSATGYIELLDIWSMASGAGPFRVDDKGNITANSITLTTPVSGQFLAVNQYAPSGQTALTTTSSTIAAVSSANVNTGNFTAPPSGNVFVTCNCILQVSTNTDAMAFGLCAHGTVTPIVGLLSVFKAPATTQPFPYEFNFYVTGLTGTNNFDLVFAVAGGGTATVFANNQSSVTPTLSNGALGGPVVMTVQAV